MEQIPHKCPICKGEGTRPKRHWTDIATTAPIDEECHACDGVGIVWGWKTSESPRPMSGSLTIKAEDLCIGGASTGSISSDQLSYTA